MTHIQKSFQHGINQLLPDIQITNSGYQWLINGRNRFGYISPIRSPVEFANAPVGIKQGVIGVGNTLVLFCAGKAYHKDDNNNWINIPNFLMSVTADQFWSQAIPASTFNFTRKANATVNADITITNDFKISGTPAGILVQDGISQPWLIEYDITNQQFVARVTKKYSEWTNGDSSSANSKEYVPIGTMMMFMNQALYVVSKDRKKIYRSITGRPLDFMINVDTDGNKAITEAQGGAATMSFAFDFDDITCIKLLDIPDSFIYGTSHNTRIVTADYLNTLFSEPTFKESARIKSGIVNQYCFSDNLGDFVLVDFDGIKSFNAVQQLKFKGSSDIFSLALTKLLHNSVTGKPIKQRYCSVINFDNYLIANLDTQFGNLFCVYDTLTKQWSSLDILDCDFVKQSTIVESTTENKLFVITNENKVFQMYASNSFESCILRTRGMIPATTSTEHKSSYFKLLFKGGTYDGEVLLREFVDDQEVSSNLQRKNLNAQVAGINYPVIPPVIPSNKQRNELVSFPLNEGLIGKSISFVVIWSNDAQLVEFQLDSSEDESNSSVKQVNDTLNT